MLLLTGRLDQNALKRHSDVALDSLRAMPLDVAVKVFSVIHSYDFNTYMNTYHYFCAQKVQGESICVDYAPFSSLLDD